MNNIPPAEPDYRPYYHYAPERNWMNDPNGMVWYDGEYHLFYQFNPHGDRWGHMCWGHAVSADLLHWRHLPLALQETDEIMIYSGSAVVDWNNTSGFGTAAQPPLVAIFTGHHTRQARQDQRLAYSTDRGRTWTPCEDNPVLDIESAEFRDPKVFWHAASSRWIMAVALPQDRMIAFFSSPDLKTWTRTGDFGPAGSTEGIWECPDLFPLAVEDEAGGIKWVLLVNVNPGAPAGGSGCQYFVGAFDGRAFRAEAGDAPMWLDHGADFYAAVSWSDVPKADGRRIIIAWMNNWRYANDTPTAPWRGAMSVPRELTLRRTPSGLRLHQLPVRELNTLGREAAREFSGGSLDEAAQWLAAQRHLPRALDVELRLTGLPQHALVALDVLLGDESGERISVRCDRNQRRIAVDRVHAGQTCFHPDFAARHEALLPMTDGALHLRLLLDACSLEVFAQDGAISLTNLMFPNAVGRIIQLRGVHAQSANVHVKLASLDGERPEGKA